MRNLAWVAALAVLCPLLGAAQELPGVDEALRRASEGARADAARVAAAPAPDRPVLTGDFPGGVTPSLESRLSEVWEFVKRLGGAPPGLPAPTVHFSPFDPAKQDAQWTLWQRGWSLSHPQVTSDWLCSYSGHAKYPEPRDSGLCADPKRVLSWMAGHPEVLAEFPFPATFRAFHYDGTDRIQVNPYTTYTGTILQGVPLALVGYGYYVTGHEMLHYVLDRKGIPGETHHCLFVTPQPPDGKSYMGRLADFLIDEKGYSHFMVRELGLGAEISLKPCAKPSP